MNDMWVTVCGNVGTQPQRVQTSGGVRTTFRLAHTPRVRGEQGWEDGATSWYTVVTWNALADNVSLSVSKGQRVLVHARHRIGEWQDDKGVTRHTAELLADSVGHDLRFGVSAFGRTQLQRPGVEALLAAGGSGVGGADGDAGGDDDGAGDGDGDGAGFEAGAGSAWDVVDGPVPGDDGDDESAWAEPGSPRPGGRGGIDREPLTVAG